MSRLISWYERDAASASAMGLLSPRSAENSLHNYIFLSFLFYLIIQLDEERETSEIINPLSSGFVNKTEAVAPQKKKRRLDIRVALCNLCSSRGRNRAYDSKSLRHRSRRIWFGIINYCRFIPLWNSVQVSAVIGRHWHDKGIIMRDDPSICHCARSLITDYRLSIMSEMRSGREGPRINGI